jgi:hypothetical protein
MISMSVSTDAPLRRALGPRALSVLALAIALTGCRAEVPTPEAALSQFVQDVRTRRAAAVWAGLSAASRAELERRAQAIAEATGAPVEKDPARLLFTDLELVAIDKPEAVTVVSPVGSEVMLQVSLAGGRSARLRMVREGTRWKVDLLGSFEGFPGYGAGAEPGEVPPGPADPSPGGSVSSTRTATAG